MHRDMQARQVEHWQAAAGRLLDIDLFADDMAWARLESATGAKIRSALTRMVRRVERSATRLRNELARNGSVTDAQVFALRQEYFRAETGLDFFADALAGRSNPVTAKLLGACDLLAAASIEQVTRPLGLEQPPILSYIDKGLGASILKAGLRLWDQHTVNPVAAIRVTRHNLLRPTSVIHEAGHQVAYATGWNEELRGLYRQKLPGLSGALYAQWTNEIAADAFGFANVGWGFAAALHDVLDNGSDYIVSYNPLGPHPIAFVRVLLNLAMCRHAFGPGPWDDLAWIWRERFEAEIAETSARREISAALQTLEPAVRIVLDAPMEAFGGKTLTSIVDPAKVAPEKIARHRTEQSSLVRIDARAALDLLALTSADIADRRTGAQDAAIEWMLRLGAARAPHFTGE